MYVPAEIFKHRTPTGVQAKKHELVRMYARQLADEILVQCPESRERTVALTNLEQATFWAIEAIARNE